MKGFLQRLAYWSPLQIYIIWHYEKVFYLTESCRSSKRLWIVLKHKSSSKCVINAGIIRIFFPIFFTLDEQKNVTKLCEKLNKAVWETGSFIHRLKSISATFQCFKFPNVCIISIYRKMELIAMYKPERF